MDDAAGEELDPAGQQRVTKSRMHLLCSSGALFCRGSHRCRELGFCQWVDALRGFRGLMLQALFGKHNSFLRLLKKKSFKEERVTSFQSIKINVFQNILDMD